MPGDYDFILLHRVSSFLIKSKLRHYPRLRFATMLGHQWGERFSRIDFSALRLQRLLGEPAHPPFPPRISAALTADLPPPRPERIAVALGARDERRRWQNWAGLLAEIVLRRNPDLLPLHFVLIGNGPQARRDLAAIPGDFLARHCTIRLDLPDLAEAAREIHRCGFFVGADGGLMHIAAALEKPGVALFAEIRPEWRLLPGNPLTPIHTDQAMAAIPTRAIVEAFLAATAASAAG